MSRAGEPARAMLASSPIFIGGLSYSGKTQLRMVLGAHPELALTRRTYLWERWYGRFGELTTAANLDRCLAALLEDPAVAPLAPDEARVRADLGARGESYAVLFGLLHEHAAARAGRRRWGDQLGFVERYAEPIFAAYPDARMVHMVRDPRGRIAAHPGAGGAGRLGWETARWVRSAELAERNRARHPDRYLVVRYEAFAADPGSTLEAVCAFVGEELLPPMREVLESLVLDTPAAPPPSRSRFVERYARHQLSSLGYAPATAHDPACPRRPLDAAAWPLNRFGMTAWRVVKDRPLVKRVGS